MPRNDFGMVEKSHPTAEGVQTMPLRRLMRRFGGQLGDIHGRINATANWTHATAFVKQD